MFCCCWCCCWWWWWCETCYSCTFSAHATPLYNMHPHTPTNHPHTTPHLAQNDTDTHTPPPNGPTPHTSSASNPTRNTSNTPNATHPPTTSDASWLFVLRDVHRRYPWSRAFGSHPGLDPIVMSGGLSQHAGVCKGGRGMNVLALCVCVCVCVYICAVMNCCT